MDVTLLDGRGFKKFFVAGTYFLRKYRGVLNDLNVFPVPDGDTGSSMYLTARSAMAESAKVRSADLAAVAAAAAHGSLLGARGNSGVILSQMVRGFAHNIRHRSAIDTLDFAIAMREAVGAARAALVEPVEGTIISVAAAAADAAYALAPREPDFYRLTTGALRAAVDALERTPEQLAVLKEAGVVDAGGAGFVYFLEGILRFLPDVKTRASALARRPVRRKTFTSNQIVAENKFCTEFVLEDAAIDVHPLRDLLAPHGDSLLVVGAMPTLRVHIHCSQPDAVKRLAAEHGRLTREKIDDMERQHHLLVVEQPAKPFSIVAVVPGVGFAQIVRELGAENAIVALDANPTVRELVIGVNASLAPIVYLLTNDANVIFAAGEAAKIAERDVRVIPTRDVQHGLAVLLNLGTTVEVPPAPPAVLAATPPVASASVFFAGKDSRIGGISLRSGAPAAQIDGRLLTGAGLWEVTRAAAHELGAGAGAGGLLTIYYGGSQKEHQARALAGRLATIFTASEIEYYYGGQRASEYLLSFES